MKKLIEENVQDVLWRIASSAGKAGRRPEEIKLLAATKNRPVDEILDAVAAGVGIIGENRVQELLEKEPFVRGAAELHFIGHLQRNKVRRLLGLVELIHSVDSVRLAREVGQAAGRMGLVQRALVQVNVAGEESKSGVEPGMLAEIIREMRAVDNLEVVGLSTIAPMVDDPEDVRWVFADLRGMAEENFAGNASLELSMGMTSDFEVAVEEGSTLVRIGTALFEPSA